MPSTFPQWQQLALYALAIAVLITLLQRLPYVGRAIRFVFSFGLLAFLIYVILQQAPYQPELARLTQRLGLDDQAVVGGELRVKMAPDGHFWVAASVDGTKTRMLIDSGATVTALSQQTVRAANVKTGTGMTPIMLRTANGVAAAETGRIDEMTIGNIVARNLKIVTAPGMDGFDVLGMNFLSQLESWRVEGRTLILVPRQPRSPPQSS